MPFALLLAMQAAGMVYDYLGTKNQAALMKQGLNLQQAGIESNIAQVQLEAEQGSVNDMKALRQTLGSQIATFAARGTSTSGGSAVSILNNSIGNFNADERVRKLNAMGKINQLRAGSAMSLLQNSSDTSKLWQGFASRTFNTISTSPAVWKQGWGALGGKSSAAAKTGGNFGLTQMAGT